MNEQRYQELIRKRDTSGLTDEEANELGRMIAERDGAPYGNATGREHPEAETGHEQPYSEAELEERKRHPEVEDAPEGSEKAS
jgi:hypothetical protein